MPRNVYFLLMLVISLVAAYFCAPLMIDLVDMFSTKRLSRAVQVMIKTDSLISVGAFISFAAVIFFVLAFILPAIHVWFYISGAKGKISDLPLACDPVGQTSKKKFLKALKDLDFMTELSVIYSGYLVQMPDREVHEDTLKKVRATKLLAKAKEGEKVTVSPVRARISASTIFTPVELIKQRLFAWFFNPLPAFLVMTGFVLLTICLFQIGIIKNTDASVFATLAPGFLAASALFCTAAVIYFLHRITSGSLTQNADEFCQMTDHLFHHHEYQNDLYDLHQSMGQTDMAKEVEKSVARPLNAMTKAARTLASDQGEKIEDLLKAVLESFTEKMDQTTTLQIENLGKSLDGAEKAAQAMQKSFETIQDTAEKSEQATTKQNEALLMELRDAVAQSHDQLSEVIQGASSQIENQQAEIQKAISSKDSILSDLNKSAKDLGGLSEASAKVIDKFGKVSRELDALLEKIKHTELADAKSSKNSPERKKMRDDLEELLGKKNGLPEL